jgi:hypothetical protein
MKLYEIADQIERFMASAIDPETGEISDEALAELDALEMDFDAKALNVAKFIRGEQAEAQAIKDAAQANLDRAASHQRRAERLTGYLDHLLRDRGRVPMAEKAGAPVVLKDHEIQIAYTISAAAVTDPVTVEPTPREFIEVVPATEKILKGEIRKRLMAGHSVPGWTLQWNRTPRIK